MEFIEVVLIGIFIVYMLFYVKEQFTEVEYITSRVDGERYLVKNLPDKQRAADLLGELHLKVEALIKEVVARYPDNPDVHQLKRNYNHRNMSEGADNGSYTSYSVNKGEQIVFCLRSRDGKERLVKKNTLMYVATHELAHLMTPEVGHTDRFWKNFRVLLKHAVDMGLYVAVNYGENPVEYCGIRITSSVLGDEAKKEGEGTEQLCTSRDCAWRR